MTHDTPNAELIARLHSMTSVACPCSSCRVGRDAADRLESLTRGVAAPDRALVEALEDTDATLSALQRGAMPPMSYARLITKVRDALALYRRSGEEGK